MSQYRDDREGLRERIAELEHTIADREAALSSKDLGLAEREAELAELRRRLALRGAFAPEALAVAVPLILAVGVLAAALLVGGTFVARRPPSPHPLPPPAAPAPPAVEVEPVPAPPAAAVEEAPPGRDDDEMRARRDIERKIAAGTATREEVRMLRAICGHQGDFACRNRAAELLARRAAQERP